MLSTDEAERLGATVGDELQVTLPLGTVEQLTVTAVYRGETLVGPALVDLGLWNGVTRTPTDDAVVARFAPTVQESDRAAALSRLDTTFPQLNVETADQFVDRIAGQIDQLLMVVNLMVALTVIIALLGITNTLALAVIERTRELGLLRAVGMGRREVRRTIRLEAAIIAAFGTALGLSVGLVLGWLGVGALPDDFATDVTVPVTGLAIVAVLAVVAAVLAAQVPARRAARLDVLTAIAS
jgi:putative ABC transport system permease protein